LLAGKALKTLVNTCTVGGPWLDEIIAGTISIDGLAQRHNIERLRDAPAELERGSSRRLG
jgi:hypothetical protein